MSDALRKFREDYLDYLDGERRAEPALESLTDDDRRAAELWIKSLNDARGIDPYAEAPSVGEVLERISRMDREKKS